jgi:hypothetical protein
LFELLIIDVFHESLGDIMQKFLVYGVGAHDLFNRPFTVRRFAEVDRSLHNTLNIGEIEPVFSIAGGTGQTFGLGLKLLAAICEGKGFDWHGLKFKEMVQIGCLRKRARIPFLLQVSLCTLGSVLAVELVPYLYLDAAKPALILGN